MWQLALGLGLIQQLSLAIVVERNMFAYYKVPAAQLLYSQEADADFDFQSQEVSQLDGGQVSDLYYVLQCPPKLAEGIPKPQDMQTCSVVDQYKGMWRKKKPKPKKRYHMVPFRIVLRPLGPPARRRSLRRRKRQQKGHNTPSNKNPYDRSAEVSSQVKLEEMTSPLQFLALPHKRQKLLKLSADHRKFKKGSRSKGHQHMYHRDESYNDHIFYDELQDDGKFHKLGKEKSN
ncbi:uncharacterized protein LOC108027002 [Drosophila biarmipes]|uniref:uncharacterized protein LOC108027002 n=1 Tax=Drosophila biarmipes TaxID=125945 RepID=UPI0007E8346E|nr:uncharacterized protein LOC108027002 [Drosophila biarmipes]